MYVHRTIYVAGGSQRVLGGTACGYAVEAKQGCPRFNRFDFVTNCQLRSIDSIDSYCTPLNAKSVLRINPVTHIVSTFGSGWQAEGTWRGGVLARDGCIYCVAYDARHVLCIDPIAQSTTTFGSIFPEMGTWFGGVLAFNVYIFDIIYYILHIS